MALHSAARERQLEHRRSLDVQICARGSGLREADAHITDVRLREVRLAAGTLPAGAPIHDMPLRLVGLDLPQPFQIDRCHALRADGPAVKKKYHPRWYRAPEGSRPKVGAPVVFDH
jgi:Protein of unknown function (DUF2889)